MARSAQNACGASARATPREVVFRPVSSERGEEKRGDKEKGLYSRWGTKKRHGQPPPCPSKAHRLSSHHWLAWPADDAGGASCLEMQLL